MQNYFTNKLLVLNYVFFENEFKEQSKQVAPNFRLSKTSCHILTYVGVI